MNTTDATVLRASTFSWPLDRTAPGGRWLVPAVYLQAAAAVFFGAWLLLDAEPLVGVHPGLKPFKFEISGAILCASMALVLPLLTASRRTLDIVGLLLAATLVFENVMIGGQALRGVLSHYNESGTFNTMVWRTIALTIQVTTVAMLWSAWRSTRSPLRNSEGEVLSAPMTLAVRAGLWLFIVATVSGNVMGVAYRHSMGGADGGPGLPLLNWSTTHGDLRVSHFFALHAIQALPLVAWLASRWEISNKGRLTLVRFVSTAYAVVVVGLFLTAVFGRPFMSVPFRG